MSFEFPVIRLGDHVEKIGSGATPRGGSNVYQSTGIALIRSQNVYNNMFSYGGLAFIGAEHAQQLQNVEVKEGDILLNITGDSVARVCQVPADVLPARVNQHVAIIRTRKECLDPRFLLYCLTSPQMQNYMLALAAAGGTRNALTKGMIENFYIPAPDIQEQRAIAHILGTLDDKIELNRRMNATLEAIARAIFKSWFVDFDPVHAKARGEQPYGMDAETAALFPDSFEDSELGPIPAGWGVKALGDIADNPRRGIKPEEMDSNTLYIGLEHMPQKSIALDAWGSASNVASNKFKFRKGEFLFGKLRPYFHKIGIAPDDGVCSTDILVVIPTHEFWYGLTLFHISSKEFVDYTTAASTGTRMPRTNWDTMSKYPVIIPDRNVAEVFSCFLRPMLETIQNNIWQSHTLAALRDALLPKLISGNYLLLEVLQRKKIDGKEKGGSGS